MSYKRNNRLLIISSELTLGGAAYLTIRWVKALHQHFHIDLLICGPIEQRMKDELPKDINIFQLESSFLMKASERFGKLNLENLSSFLKYKNINVLQEHYMAVIGTSIFWSWASCAVYYLAKSPKKIIFILDEGLLSFFPKKNRLNSIIDLALLATNYFISVSEELWSKVSSFKGIENEKLTAVMMPPCAESDSDSGDQTKFNDLICDKPIVLTIARIDPVKRILESLYWHHELKSEGIDFRWYIIGDGVQKDFISNEVKRLGMSIDFILAGFDSNVNWWLRQCDIFALFSMSEGCPTVVIEALQARKLVICTQVNGVSDFIETGKTGLIVSHEPEDIKKNLKCLILNKALREQYQNNLMNTTFKNNFNSNVKKMQSIIQNPISHVKQNVTILIPTFNQASMLERAIESSINQNYARLNVVVMDDASTDDTKNVCDKWLSNPRFKYVRNEHNLGRVNNYQNGLNHFANGDWVLMLDGDDYLTDPCFIKRALSVINQYPDKEIGFIQAGHRVTNLIKTQPDKDIFPNIEQDYQLFEPGQYIPFILKTGFFSHLGLLFNRQLAIKCQAYSNDISSSDIDSFMRLSLISPVIVFKHIAGAWVQHGANASSQVHVNDIYKNLRIFRYYSIKASSNGLIGLKKWPSLLLKYEAKNLTFLFEKTLGNSVNYSFQAFRIFVIAWQIYPCLVFHPRVIKTSFKSFYKLLYLKKHHVQI